MDRWQNADDDLSEEVQPGRVARMGLQGFVSSSQAPNFKPGTQLPKDQYQSISILPSKKEQRQLEDIKRMPPPSVTKKDQSLKNQPYIKSHNPIPQQQKNLNLYPQAKTYQQQIQPQQQAQQQQQLRPQQKVHQHLINQQPLTYKPPSDVTDPPNDRKIEVYKDDLKIQEFFLNKGYLLFGRHLDADVVLEHASISRQHAVLLFLKVKNRWDQSRPKQTETQTQSQQTQHKRKNSQYDHHDSKQNGGGGEGGGGDSIQCFLQDLGATHGTFVDGRRLEKFERIMIHNKQVVHFGASTRKYMYALDESQLGKKRQRIKFADEGYQNEEEGKKRLVQV